MGRSMQSLHDDEISTMYSRHEAKPMGHDEDQPRVGAREENIFMKQKCIGRTATLMSIVPMSSIEDLFDPPSL